MQSAGFLSADKNTFLWALVLAAWPRLKNIPLMEGRLFCLRYAGQICSLWVGFGAGDVRAQSAPRPPEVKVKDDTWS